MYVIEAERTMGWHDRWLVYDGALFEQDRAKIFSARLAETYSRDGITYTARPASRDEVLRYEEACATA